MSGNEKLFRLDLASGKSTQLTFGTHDEGGAQFLDADTLVFTSTATDPAKADRSRRRQERHHSQRLDAQPEERRAAAVHRRARPATSRRSSCATARPTPRIAFVTYYKGEYGLHTLDRKEPLAKAATADFGAPGPVIDFQAPMTHTLVAENKKKKGKFEKMFLDGRPPVALGVTSGGDFFGGTQISFTDVLGDQQFNMFAASVSQYRTHVAQLHEPRAAASSTRCRATRRRSSSTARSKASSTTRRSAACIDRDLAVATRTLRGGTAFGIYPFNRYRRVEFYGGFVNYNEEFDDPALAGRLAAVPAGAVRHARSSTTAT